MTRQMSLVVDRVIAEDSERNENHRHPSLLITWSELAAHFKQWRGERGWCWMCQECETLAADLRPKRAWTAECSRRCSPSANGALPGAIKLSVICPDSAQFASKIATWQVA